MGPFIKFVKTIVKFLRSRRLGIANDWNLCRRSITLDFGKVLDEFRPGCSGSNVWRNCSSKNDAIGPCGFCRGARCVMDDLWTRSNTITCPRWRPNPNTRSSSRNKLVTSLWSWSVCRRCHFPWAFYKPWRKRSRKTRPTGLSRRSTTRPSSSLGKWKFCDGSYVVCLGR